jgi:hypothetical protein
MPKLEGINHQRAIKAFKKAGFWIARKGKYNHDQRGTDYYHA